MSLQIYGANIRCSTSRLVSFGIARPRGFLIFVSLFLLIERFGHFSGWLGHFSG